MPCRSPHERCLHLLTLSGVVQSLVGPFEQLALGPGGPTAPGQPPETAADPAAYPRPLEPGAGDPPLPPEPRSCDAAFMRPTVNAVPSTPALKARRAARHQTPEMPPCQG